MPTLILIVISLAVATFIIFRLKDGSKKVDSRITLNDLNSVLTQLKDGEIGEAGDGEDYITIGSKKIYDYIYIYYNHNNTFDIEYEQVSDDFQQYMQAVKHMANERRYKTKSDSYDTSSSFSEMREKNREDSTIYKIRLCTQMNRKEVIELMKHIQINLFGNNEETKFEVN